jgi:chorismate-pyruvate lyase
MVFHILKKKIWQRAANFICTRSSLLESVIVTEFQATEAYSSLDLTKANYSITRLFVAEKEKASIRIKPNSFIECEKRNST